MQIAFFKHMTNKLFSKLHHGFFLKRISSSELLHIKLWVALTWIKVLWFFWKLSKSSASRRSATWSSTWSNGTTEGRMKIYIRFAIENTLNSDRNTMKIWIFHAFGISNCQPRVPACQRFGPADWLREPWGVMSVRHVRVWLATPEPSS